MLALAVHVAQHDAIRLLKLDAPCRELAEAVQRVHHARKRREFDEGTVRRGKTRIAHAIRKRHERIAAAFGPCVARPSDGRHRHEPVLPSARALRGEARDAPARRRRDFDQMRPARNAQARLGVQLYDFTDFRHDGASV